MSNSKNEKLFSNLNFQNQYKYGFSYKIDKKELPIGLNPEIIKKISQIKKEPKWILDIRLKAYKHLQKINIPNWSLLDLPEIDLQKISYFSAPNKKLTKDKKLQTIFDKLNIPLKEKEQFQKVAIDAVVDSSSVFTSHQKYLKKLGIIFCPLSEAIIRHSDLIQKYFGSVVPFTDNYFACLNTAVFSDGTFVYIPKNVKCPIDLSTYFRINSLVSGQFERTLIICDDNASCNYLEGCTAPIRKNHQLHTAIVEIIVKDNAKVNYSTVQNWYSGNKKGKGGILNFVTKRGLAKGKNSQINWTQLEIGSSITWKYPSTILKGDGSKSEFYSLAITNNYQQADTGSKMWHIGKNTKSKIISKSISLRKSKNIFRSLVDIKKNSDNSRNYTQCDSLILSKTSKTYAIPTIINRNLSATVEHEASSSYLNESHLIYLKSRGLDTEKSLQIIITGNSQEILKRLPLEFVAEAKKILELNIENWNG